jgi:hypothetical protein
MSSDAAITVAIFIITTSLVVLMIIVGKRRQAAKEDEMKRQASARGWTFQAETRHGYRVHRWSGSTDGVAWRTESAVLTSGGHKHQGRRYISRWHAGWTAGVAGPVVCMAVKTGGERYTFQVAQGDGMFAQLAQRAAGAMFDKFLDIYFGEEVGKEVDAGALRRVESAAAPGYIVMAADKDEGARVLTQGLDKGLAQLQLADTWVCLRKDGVSLARTQRIKAVADIDALIQAGLTLKRAFTFSRSSPF